MTSAAAEMAALLEWARLGTFLNKIASSLKLPSFVNQRKCKTAFKRIATIILKNKWVITFNKPDGKLFKILVENSQKYFKFSRIGPFLSI